MYQISVYFMKQPKGPMSTFPVTGGLDVRWDPATPALLFSDLEKAERVASLLGEVCDGYDFLVEVPQGMEGDPSAFEGDDGEDE